MPSHKRKRPEFFDPNKSDSDDVDYVSGQDRPRKAPRKSRTKSKGASSKKKRTKYRGSDVDDDDLSDSLLDESFSEPEEEEDMDIDPVTGRTKRKAAKKSVNYEEPPSDEDMDEDSNSQNSDEDIATPQKKRKMVKLKISTPAVPARTARAGSTARSRGRASVEPTSAPPTRRSTRARSEVLDEPLLALTNSGNHVQVVRGSESPETALRVRSARGGKGLKKPIEVVQEVSQEESHEAEQDEEMAEADAQVEEADQDEEKEKEVADSQPKKVDEQPDSDRDELEGNTPQPPAADGDSDDDDDDDDMPVVRSRTTRASASAATKVDEEVEETSGASRRLTRRAAAKKAKGSNEQSSDFEPVEDSGEEDISASDASPKKGKGDDDTDSSPRGRKSARGKSKSARSSRRRVGSDDEDEDELDRDELLEEAHELKANSRRRPQRHKDPEILYEPAPRRSRKPVDYRIKPMDQIYAADEDLEDAAPSPTRRSRGGRGGASQPWERNLHTTYGPFGGGGGPAPVIGGPWGTGATGGVDSDSSDDENLARPNVGGNVGMTPTSAMPGGLLPGIGQTNPSDPITALGGTPANFGKIKSQKALADADPLGVDQNVDFSKVGGLQGHIDQLKEMVQMPLLYPELFLKFHVTPPRGVLFHGPPGTGKTLLARALAAQVGSGGRKITFYMRKGADALSKWVGEAERQLRLLFEEARKTQPSIIFFDEIDGLAPVRSSKQEQIHASIVSTLLALMDGMDGRGQVIVIGATNRPDNIDPALRRPGRFDREFYFPLPDIEGRRSIIDIHTNDWGIDDTFKDSLAHATKGYGGADLRALCTEAALNSIQRTYPQIYSSNEKLVVDVDKIKITAKDFMLSIKKMIPSSERSTSSGAAPLPKVIEPLLREQVKEIEGVLDGLIPSKKKTTALQEAMYEQYDDADSGFNRETLQQEFEKSRVFRPRLLIGGEPGMGQAYIGAALLDHFEGLHVQNFDLPTIYSDSTRSAETAIVQLFQEVRRHKPSVIYLPGIDTWYHTLSESAITTFVGLLNGLPPTDPVLVLGITNEAPDKVSHDMLRDLFGFSKKNRFLITRPSRKHREEFFANIIDYIRKTPKDFPDPVNRKLRKLETLAVAPPPPPRIPTKEELKAQKQRDHQILNALKVLIQPVMDQIQKKYRKFRNPVIPQSSIQYLYDEKDPNYVRSNVAQFRPYELDTDKDGIPGFRETATGKFFYNLETTTIEERLSNGFYARPKDFVADIRSLTKDAKNSDDRDRSLKAKELLANVEVDLAGIEANPAMAECENVYQRQLQRAKEKADKAQNRAEKYALTLVGSDIPVPGQNAATDESSGPVILGDPLPQERPTSLFTNYSTPTSLSNGHATGMSNGSSVSARHGEDIHMGGTDGSQHTPDSQRMPPPISQWSQKSRVLSNVSGVHTQVSQFSQRSAFQSLPVDVSPDALLNDASTTSSGKKTSDPSNRSSYGTGTQVTNGKHELSSFFSPPQRETEDSQLLDTQQEYRAANSQQDVWLHSQAYLHHNDTSSSTSQATSQPAVPAFAPPARPPASDGDLQSTLQEASSSQISSQKDIILDEAFMSELLERFVTKSSGCSIEQLEQINRELMDTLWKLRGEYNRTKVGTELGIVFNDVIKDIEEMQKVLKASQEQESQERVRY